MIVASLTPQTPVTLGDHGVVEPVLEPAGAEPTVVVVGDVVARTEHLSSHRSAPVLGIGAALERRLARA